MNIFTKVSTGISTVPNLAYAQCREGFKNVLHKDNIYCLKIDGNKPTLLDKDSIRYTTVEGYKIEDGNRNQKNKYTVVWYHPCEDFVNVLDNPELIAEIIPLRSLGFSKKPILLDSTPAILSRDDFKRENFEKIREAAGKKFRSERSDLLKGCEEIGVFKLNMGKFTGFGLPKYISDEEEKQYAEYLENNRAMTTVQLGRGTRRNRKTKKPRKWSMKYKKSINCKRPKGFSQRQYCKYGQGSSKRRSPTTKFIGRPENLGRGRKTRKNIGKKST